MLERLTAGPSAPDSFTRKWDMFKPGNSEYSKPVQDAFGLAMLINYYCYYLKFFLGRPFFSFVADLT